MNGRSVACNQLLELKKMSNVARLFTTAFSIAYCTQSFGQIASDGSLPARNKFDVVEVVTKLPSDDVLRQRSLVAKGIYGRQELDRFGDNNLADLLSNLPGVQMQNGVPSLSGMDAKYTKILWNGETAPAGVRMEQINPALVDRIEITRGQSANQSAQSIAGTINIVFKDPARTSQNSIRYGVAYQNERPTPFATYTFGGKEGDLSYSIPFSVQEVLQTFRVNTEKRIVAGDGTISSGYQEKYWRYQHVFATINPRITYTINDDEKLTSQTFIQSSQRQLLHQYERTIFAGDPQLDLDFKSQTAFTIIRSNLNWAKNLNNKDRLEAKIGVASNSSPACWTQTDANRVQVTTACGDERETSVFYGFNYTHLVNSAHELKFGLDVDRKKNRTSRSEAYLGATVDPLVYGRDFNSTVDTNAIYIQDEWEINKQWAANVGLRSETLRLAASVPDQLLNTGSTDSNSTNTVSLVNPIFHFSYRPDGDDKYVFRGGISRAYKAPDVDSLGLSPSIVIKDPTQLNSAISPDVVGNSTLKPETATGLDLSYETKFGKIGFASLGAFYRDVENIIVDVTTLQNVSWASVPRWVNQPTNIAHGTTYGLELEVKAAASDVLPVELVPNWPLNLRLNMNVYGSRIDAIPGPNNRFPQQSPWSSTIGFDCKPMDALTMGASVFVAPQYDRQGPVGDTYTQSQLRWINAFAQYTVDSKSSLRLGINNLFPSANATTLMTEFSDRRSNRTGRTGITLTYEKKL